jgi:hypothetical protein
MVGGDEFLGCNQGMKQWGVDCAKNGYVLGGAEKSDRPGNRFERAAVKVRITSVPSSERSAT